MTYFRNLNNINVIDAYFSYVIYIYVYDCDAPWRLYMTVRHCHEKKSNSRWKIRNFFPDLAWPEKIYIFFRNIPMMNSHWSSKWGASRADHFIRMYNFFLDVYNTSRIYCFLSKNQNTIEANKFRWNAELWQTKFVQSFYYKLTKNKIFETLRAKIVNKCPIMDSHWASKWRAPRPDYFILMYSIISVSIFAYICGLSSPYLCCKISTKIWVRNFFPIGAFQIDRRNPNFWFSNFKIFSFPISKLINKMGRFLL